MYVTGFNPYDSDTWPDPDENTIDQSMELSQYNNPSIDPSQVANQSSSYYSESETESEAPPPQCAVAYNEPDVICTDLANIRQVLATRTNYTEGRLGNHLHGVPGLIILPLQAVSCLRIPHGHHVGNPKVLIFHPTRESTQYPTLGNFLESLAILYQQQ